MPLLLSIACDRHFIGHLECRSLTLQLLQTWSHYFTEQLTLQSAPTAMEIQKAVLGEQHPVFAGSVNNLAALYWKIGLYEKAEPLYCQAEPLYLQAIELQKTALGEQHPDFAKSAYNLADLYSDMVLYDKSAPLYLQAMKLRKTVLCEQHTEFCTQCLYSRMGLYGKAEPQWSFGKQF